MGLVQGPFDGCVRDWELICISLFALFIFFLFSCVQCYLIDYMVGGKGKAMGNLCCANLHVRMC